jgi:hypothetical protein
MPSHDTKKRKLDMSDNSHSAGDTYKNDSESFAPTKSTISVVDRLFSAVNAVTTARHMNASIEELTPTTTLKQTVVTILMANDVYDIAPFVFINFFLLSTEIIMVWEA